MLLGYTNICNCTDTHTASEHSPCLFNPTVHTQNLLRLKNEWHLKFCVNSSCSMEVIFPLIGLEGPQYLTQPFNGTGGCREFGPNDDELLWSRGTKLPAHNTVKQISLLHRPLGFSSVCADPPVLHGKEHASSSKDYLLYFWAQGLWRPPIELETG